MRKPSEIKIGKKKYPIICNLNVLEEIQEKYGSINNFEMKLLGLIFQRDENKAIIYNADGDPLLMVTEPSIDAVKTALIAMVKEGERVKAYLDGASEPEYTDPEILIGECETPFSELSEILHEEYKKCFVSKKQ